MTKAISREQREGGFLIEFERKQRTLGGNILVNSSGEDSLKGFCLSGQSPVASIINV